MSPRKYTDDQLAAAVRSSPNMHQVLIALGLAPRGGNYEVVRRRIGQLGMDASHLRGRGLRSKTDDEIASAVRSSRSYAEVFNRLGIKQGGGSQASLIERIERLSLDISHFRGQGWRRGSSKPVVPARPLEEVLVAGKFMQTSNLKRRLIEERVKEPHCEICRLNRWNGQPIPLELDHVNGRRDDNRPENLRIVCPNCHAQTPTYRGRNIGAAGHLS